MNYQSSYKIQDFSVDISSEIERLNAQVELFWEKEFNLYRMYGLKDGMSIAECGCGPGLVGKKLLEAFPNCQITAFDIDPILVETAKKNAQLWKLDRYEVGERSILQSELPDDTFDFAIARLVLEHLSTPIDAVKEVFRILKPGGTAIFVDNDFEFHLRTFPDIPELRDLYQAYCSARQDDDGNPKIGRELPTLLRQAGYSDIDLQIISAHSEVVGDEMFLQSEGSGIPAKLVKDGYLSGDTYTKIASKWYKLLKTEGHSMFRQLFLGVGTKVLTPPAQQKVLSKQSENDRKPTIEQERPSKAVSEKPKADVGRPITSVASKVSEIWSKILNRDSIGKDENFFEAGGSSLQAVEIIKLLEKHFPSELSVVDLFDHPTIALLTKHIQSQTVSVTKKDLSPEHRRELRLNKIQQRREKIKKLKDM